MADVKNSIDGEALEILKRLEPVLTAVAADVAGLKTDVAGLKTEVAAIHNRLSRVEGQLVNMPHSLTLVTAILMGMVGNALVIGGIVFAVMSYARVPG